MPSAHDHGGAGRIPFWIHQLVELLLAALLLVEGARTGEHTVVLVTLGAVLLLLALCSDGALGAWPWIGRRLHRALDLVAAFVLAVSPFVLGLDRVLAIVLIEIAALAMVWLALRTEWRAKPKRTKPARAKPADASTPPADAPTPRADAPSAPPAPPVARQLGSAVARARDDGPRQLGRLVGRAQRATKAALSGPETPARPGERPPTTSDAPDDGPP